MGGDGDLRAVTRVLASGHLRPTIDSVHAFDHALGAFERLTAGSHLGKIVVDVRGRANETVLDGV
jgi:alcohol dehydrogenase